MTLSFLYPTALYALLLLPLLLALPFVGRRASTHGPATRPRREGAGVALQGRTFNFWVGLTLRAVVLLGLILSLAGTQVVQAVNDTTVVFVVDRSDSVPQAERERAEDFVRASLATMKADDRAAVVVFGEEALVERLASDDTTLAPITSAPRTTHTHLTSALRLALALFPEETHKRIVLLSDGLENVGHAADLVDLAVARGVQIDVMPLQPASGGAEAYLDVLEAPAAVRKGQTFEIVAVIYSTGAGPASLRLFGDGKLIATRDLTLQPGDNRVSFSLTGDEPGFHRYTAELQAAGDTLPQNNVASAFSVVHGPPRVLVVSSGDADNLIAALESANVETEHVAPAVLTGDLATLSNYDAVFLVNIPARALPDAAMNALPTYVRDLGRGLVMIGGPEAYGAGGYLRTPVEKAMPVDMDVRSRTQEPNLALVFAIDKSGSMGRCHCDDPSAQPGSYTRIESGLSKVDIAKDAVMQAARAVGRADYVGVVAFDANALWALRVQEMIDPDFVQQQIGGLRAEGQTNIHAGLSEAEAALEETPARLKHVVLLTDGWSRSFEYDALGRRLHDKGITLSVIAAGSGSATYLEQLARRAGGRYYAARTMTEVPSLFFKDTVEAAGSYIVEEPFYPVPAGATPILRGLDVTRLPALRGYNGTTPKSTAQVSLVSSQGDPLLATWQYGLGRAAAWTSDVKGQWATDWIQWNGFNTFIAQLTSWALPQPADEGLQTMFASDGEQTVLEVTSTDADDRPRDLLDTHATVVGPDSSVGQAPVSQAITLTQVASGRYRGRLPAVQPGTYLVQVTQQDADGTPVASATTGLIVPYSPEYKSLSEAASVLPELSRATAGQVLAEPELAFAPLARPASRAQPIWPALLLVAALLFPVDVAARRLRLTRGDAGRIWAWMRTPLRRRGAAAAPRPRALGTLFAARDQAIGSRSQRIAQPASPVVEDERPSRPPPESKEPSPGLPASPEAMTERLRRAKDRARKSRPG
jgi:uncharacterized membrane protein